MKVQALIELVLNEAMRLGQRPHGAYRNYWTIYNPIISFFRDKGLEDYSVEVLQEYIDLVTKKYQNGQIKRVRHSMLTTAARRVAHFERTGSYLWNVPKRGTRYELDAANALNTILEELVRKSVLSFLHCDILAKPSTIFAQILKRVADIGYTAVQVSGTCAYDAQWLKSLWNRKSLLRMTLFSPAKSFGNRPGNPGRLFSLCQPFPGHQLQAGRIGKSKPQEKIQDSVLLCFFQFTLVFIHGNSGAWVIE